MVFMNSSDVAVYKYNTISVIKYRTKWKFTYSVRFVVMLSPDTQEETDEKCGCTCFEHVCLILLH